LSVDREQRATEGQAFLQECFSEFNTALEQGNPIEKKLKNHLSLIDSGKMVKKMSLMDLAGAAATLVNSSPRVASLWNEATGGSVSPTTSEV
jgi:histidine ammonia-lyase